MLWSKTLDIFDASLRHENLISLDWIATIWLIHLQSIQKSLHNARSMYSSFKPFSTARSIPFFLTNPGTARWYSQMATQIHSISPSTVLEPNLQHLGWTLDTDTPDSPQKTFFSYSQLAILQVSEQIQTQSYAQMLVSMIPESYSFPAAQQLWKSQLSSVSEVRELPVKAFDWPAAMYSYSVEQRLDILEDCLRQVYCWNPIPQLMARDLEIVEHWTMPYILLILEIPSRLLSVVVGILLHLATDCSLAGLWDWFCCRGNKDDTSSRTHSEENKNELLEKLCRERMSVEELGEEQMLERMSVWKSLIRMIPGCSGWYCRSHGKHDMQPWERLLSASLCFCIVTGWLVERCLSHVHGCAELA